MSRDDFDENDESTGTFDPAELEVGESLFDVFEQLLFGFPPGKSLGWAWSRSQEWQPSTVLINGVPHKYDPLTKQVTKL